jgi:hypothetical protein
MFAFNSGNSMLSPYQQHTLMRNEEESYYKARKATYLQIMNIKQLRNYRQDIPNQDKIVNKEVNGFEMEGHQGRAQHIIKTR